MNWPPRESVRLLVVMTVYKSADLAIACLESLEPQISDVPGTFVAICENGSGTPEADRLERVIAARGWDRWVGVRRVHPNRGFTGGNNAIIEPAMTWSNPPECMLLLNTDTLVGKGALKRLFECLQRNERTGIVGPQLTWSDGTHQQCCFRDPSIFGQFLHAARTGVIDRFLRSKLTPLPLPHTSGPHDWKTFACALVRTEVFRQVGVLDEGYFLYMDDPDLCHRARRAGWEIRHCNDAEVVHLKGGSNDVPSNLKARKRLPHYYYVSRARYFAKRHGIAGLWLANLCWHAGRVISFTRELVQRRPSHLPKAQWRDIWTNAFRPWHAPHLPHPPLEAEVEATAEAMASSR